MRSEVFYKHNPLEALNEPVGNFLSLDSMYFNALYIL